MVIDMTYYSGTSAKDYKYTSRRYLRDPLRPPMEIHCYEDNIFGAIAFAVKRAKQDYCEPLVIEITRPEDFQRTDYLCYPILKGKLTPENHRTWTVDELVREIPECSHLSEFKWG